MRYFTTLFFLFLLFGPVSKGQDRVVGPLHATRSEVLAEHGMAATSHPLATQIALDILKQGGSAVDAAIAANAALGLMEPTGCGVGGDLFAIVWDANTKKLYGLNGSGRSPQRISRAYFKEKGLENIPSFGPLPVSVPGTVDAWYTLHQKFGELTMAKNLAPAIAYAKKGFPVTELIGFYLNRSARYFQDFPNFSEVYMPEGKALTKGDLFKNPQLATTYERLAQGGRDSFYTGTMARTMANFIQEQGGFLSYQDLAQHRSEWVEPMSVDYRGYQVWELPPNGQGLAALQILEILEGFDIRQMGFGSADYVHHFIEAKKLAFEDRAKYYADPAFNEIDYQELIDPDYIAERRKQIKPNRAADQYSPGAIEQGNTIYLTVADSAGNMVSLIQSNYRGMGSGMVPPGLGFMLQDRGELFSLEEGHYNALEGGKRPFHTIIPAFITKDDQPWISFGLMGGAMQPQGHAQIVINLIDFEMNLQAAGDAPRLRHSGSSAPTGGKMKDGGILHLESGFDYSVIRNLMLRGHRIEYDLGGYGGYQAIMKHLETGIYYGASESRKDGQAAGY